MGRSLKIPMVPPKAKAQQQEVQRASHLKIMKNQIFHLNLPPKGRLQVTVGLALEVMNKTEMTKMIKITMVKKIRKY